MKYLTSYATEDIVKSRSAAIAISKGCTGDVTLYWFNWFKHPKRDEWAMTINDCCEPDLTEEERALLKTKEECGADGWFEEE